MILALIRKPLHGAVIALKDWRVRRVVEQLRRGARRFQFDDFSRRVSGFVASMQVEEGGVRFRYAPSCTRPTLYASMYACMIHSLLGTLGGRSQDSKQAWIDYFDSLQDPEDGLFYDPAVVNDLYRDSDWWGARHLAMHAISAYTDLGGRPRHPFRFLRKYYDQQFLQSWLDQQDWRSNAIGEGDVDNKIMNIGCLLQYQRERWGDAQAAAAMDFLKDYLLRKINPATGLWGGFDVHDPDQRSRMVQFAYHLLLLYFYDGHFDFRHDDIVDLVLKTENGLGGYGVRANSSACEDIDSIDMLIRLAPFVSEARRARISESIRRALEWVLLNTAPDGGFVFRLAEPLPYGSPETSSRAGEGAMMPTWFRVLSIAYMTRYLQLDQRFTLTSCPGCEFEPTRRP